MTPLAQWLAWLGLSHRSLARELGISESAIGVALFRGTRPRWLNDLAQISHVPPDTLFTVSPTSPAARPYNVRALIPAARRRLTDADRRPMTPRLTVLERSSYSSL
jgi:hypothetical protein